MLAVLALGAGACGAARGEPAPFDPAPIDAVLQSFVDDGRAAGASALVYKDGKEVYFGAFGVRDRERGQPMTRDTIVAIQSMTKPITGVALMRLHEQGKFDLDDPIEKYAPEFAGLKVWSGFDEDGGMILVDPKRPPSIRDLGRHTAGFYVRGYPSPLQELVKAVNPINPNNTLAEFAAQLGTLPLLYHPGERIVYAYSTDVEAFLVERLSGQRYDAYLKQHIFKPLGMTDTAHYVPRRKRSRMAAEYDVSPTGDLTRVPGGGQDRRWPLTPGGFGLTSTIDDYMRFALMIQNEGELQGKRLLKAETVRLMGRDQLPATVSDRTWPSPEGHYGWGIDFAVRTAPATSADEYFGVVGEMYWEGAGGTLFWVDPVNDLTAVFFVQVSPYGSLHRDFRKAVYAAFGIGFAGGEPSP